jgi:hypothetical protein
MLKTIKASIDKDGTVHLNETVKLNSKRKALVTILEEDSELVDEVTILSESPLSKDWDKPEEDKAWAHLQHSIL